MTEPRRRRLDPDRRDRIIDAALEVIAHDGVAGTSHRRVAREADVPLGSMTYHFDNMDELLQLAMTRFAEQASRSFRSALENAGSVEEAQDAVIRLITRGSTERDLVITHEIYTLAARRAEFREITRDWMARDQALFEEYFDPLTARVLNVLIEGLTLHQALDTEQHDAAVARAAVEGAVRAHAGTR